MNPKDLTNKISQERTKVLTASFYLNQEDIAYIMQRGNKVFVFDGYYKLYRPFTYDEIAQTQLIKLELEKCRE